MLLIWVILMPAKLKKPIEGWILLSDNRYINRNNIIWVKKHSDTYIVVRFADKSYEHFFDIDAIAILGLVEE